MRPLLLCLLCLQCVCSLKILFYIPKMAVSHTKTMGTMADVLVEAGHNVTTLMPIMDTEQPTEGTKLSKMVYVQPGRSNVAFMRTWNARMTGAVWRNSNYNPFAMKPIYALLADLFSTQCNDTIHTPGLLDSLREENFDFGVSEALDHCGLTLFHLLGIKKYAVASTVITKDNINDDLGIPAAPSYVPVLLTPYNDRMSFLERCQNLVAFVAGKYLGDLPEAGHDRINAQLGIELPNMKDMVRGASISLVNTEPLVDFPRPTLHKIINIGGISVPPKNEKPLDEYWDSLLSLRPRTVLVSFGTIAYSSLMPVEFKQALLRACAAFPDTTFIWKYEREDGVAAGVANVVTAPWLPQQQLLADARISVFMTHAGLGSTYEALARGKAVVAIPVFADQMRNARMIERIGSGVVLDKSDLAYSDRIIEALNTTLNDLKYQAQAVRTAEMLANKPFPARDLLVKNVEFAAKYGPFPQLNPHGQHMAFIQFYSLDVIAFITSITVFVVFGIVLILNAIVRRISVTKIIKSKFE